MGFGEALRAELVGIGLKPPVYDTVAAAGTIISFAPSTGKYPVLVIFQCTTDTDANTVNLQVLDTTSTWRTILNVRLLGNTAFAMGFPALKLNKGNSNAQISGWGGRKLGGFLMGGGRGVKRERL